MPLSSPVTRTPQQMSPNPRHSVSGIQAIPSVNMANGPVQTFQVFDPNFMIGNGAPRSPGSPTTFGKENGNGVPGSPFVTSNGSVVLSSLETTPRFNPSASGFKKYPGMPMTPNPMSTNMTGIHNNSDNNNNGDRNEESNEENESSSSGSSTELGTHSAISRSLNRRRQNSNVLVLSNDIQRRDQDDTINRQLSIPQVCILFLEILIIHSTNAVSQNFENHCTQIFTIVQTDNCTRYLDITPHLNLPQSDAAKKLGIPTSTLSKRWKEAVRTRKWPYRFNETIHMYFSVKFLFLLIFFQYIRAICKLDKEIMTLLHNIPQGHDPSGQLPEDIETTLGYLLRRRQEELKPVIIRL
jgi:hypothetical protein